VYAEVAIETGVALFADGWAYVQSRPELRLTRFIRMRKAMPSLPHA